jgi:type II secretory pathway predicted ATPase ExeA
MSEQALVHRNPMDNNFFYGGANRGATLDALIYVLTHGEGAEGIITVSGEGGSGKSTLCRMLMKRLPAQAQSVYLAKPSSTPEELLDLITQQLKSGLAGLVDKGEKGGVGNDIDASRAFENGPAIASELHRLLDEKYAAGKRVILLIDEAQALSADMLDELRALYELESPRHKLLQIVLFGQKELVHTLSLPRMHKLKGYITHRFDLKPFSRKTVNEYLIARMRAMGHRGPRRFTPEAIKLIAMASGGLIHQLNILAGRSLQIASSGRTPDINTDHVNAALKDTGIEYRFTWQNWSDWSGLNHRAAGVSAILATVVLGLLGWLALRSPSAEVSPVVASAAPEISSSVQAPVLTPVPVPAPIPVPVPTPVTAYPPSASTMAANVPSTASPAGPASSAGPGAAIGMKGPQDNRTAAAGPTMAGSTAGGSTTAGSYRAGKLHIAGVKLEGYKLLEQRVEATMKLMGTLDKNQYTIQLFWTDNVQPDRMERFLIRAEKLVNLSDLYVHPENNGDKAKFRVTYGIYPNRDQAAAAITGLPEKYQSSFHPELVALSDLR